LDLGLGLFCWRGRSRCSVTTKKFGRR
jgi:hypothetical protein